MIEISSTGTRTRVGFLLFSCERYWHFLDVAVFLDKYLLKKKIERETLHSGDSTVWKAFAALVCTQMINKTSFIYEISFALFTASMKVFNLMDFSVFAVFLFYSFIVYYINQFTSWPPPVLYFFTSLHVHMGATLFQSGQIWANPYIHCTN